MTLECCNCKEKYCGIDLSLPNEAHADELCPNMKKELENQGFEQLSCCNVYAENPEGYNLIKCTLCHKSVCWLCGNSSVIRDEFYDHLIKKHQEFYQENKVDEFLKLSQ